MGANITREHQPGLLFSEGQNFPPRTPEIKSPLNGEKIIDTKSLLTWSCFDPDKDTLLYDVYLDSNPVPTTNIASNIENSQINIDFLNSNTTYYWKVVAKDGEFSTESPVWNFTAVTSLIVDSDGDGVGDNADAFPNDPTKKSPDEPPPNEPPIVPIVVGVGVVVVIVFFFLLKRKPKLIR